MKIISIIIIIIVIIIIITIINPAQNIKTWDY